MALWAWWRSRRTSDGNGKQNGAQKGTTGTGERTNETREAGAAHGVAGGQEAPGERLLELAGRRTVKTVAPQIGKSVLELAEENGVDFASNCRRGTCARCRCRVVEGGPFLSEPNEAETLRLEPDEIAEGYRLGCQARVTGIGPMRIRHAPYF